MASSPITLRQIDGETVIDLFSWAPKSLQMVTAVMKLPDTCSLGFPDSSISKESNAEDPSPIPGSGRSIGEGKGYPLQYSGLEYSMSRIVHGVTKSWTQLTFTFTFLERKAMTNLDSILKSRDIIFPAKVHLVKAMVFPVVMYGCESWTIKKAEHQRIDAFELWRRLLRVPWTARSNQFILKETSPEYLLEGLMLKLKLQYLGHLMQRTDSLEKTLMLGKIEGRGWDSYLASLTQWTWVWAGSGTWWWTGKPGVLQSTGSQRLSDWTETQRGRKTSRHTWQIDFTSNPILICGRRCLVPATRKGFKITAGLSRPWCCDLIVMSSTDAEVESRGLCGAKVTSVGPKQKTQVPLQNENLPSYFLWYK